MAKKKTKRAASGSSSGAKPRKQLSMTFTEDDEAKLEAIRDALLDTLPQGYSATRADAIRHCIAVAAEHHGVG